MTTFLLLLKYFFWSVLCTLLQVVFLSVTKLLLEYHFWVLFTPLVYSFFFCFFYICLPLLHLLTDRGVETRKGGMRIYIPPNNLSIVCICIPPIIWLWCAFERRSPLQFGEQSFHSFGEDLIFWSSLYLLTWKKSWSRFIPPKLEIAQNWGKIANYPPNAQQRWAPLVTQRPKPFLVKPTKSKIFLLISKKNTFSWLKLSFLLPK